MTLNVQPSTLNPHPQCSTLNRQAMFYKGLSFNKQIVKIMTLTPQRSALNSQPSFSPLNPQTSSYALL